jgi:membrane-associated phospholipid phosphatase
VSFRPTYRQAMPFVLVLYLLAVAGAFLYFNMRLTVEWLALILFVAAILTGRALLFVRDWGVFIAVLLAWQVVSAFATNFAFPWHLNAMINADKFMFMGTVPTVWLQGHLYHPGVLEPWDVLASTMYLLHFAAPLVAGFLLWMADRAMFHKFAITFVMVAVAGFITYILYPAVPPWLAGSPLLHVNGQYVSSPYGHVYLPGVKNLFQVAIGNWYNPYHGNIDLTFLHLHYDQVAAMPSEHAMYPMLFFLFLRRQFGRVGYLALVYIALLLFSITYLGQHYVIDAVVGFAYAIVAYNLVMHGVPALMRAFAPHPHSLEPRALRPELEEA